MLKTMFDNIRQFKTRIRNVFVGIAFSKRDPATFFDVLYINFKRRSCGQIICVMKVRILLVLSLATSPCNSCRLHAKFNSYELGYIDANSGSRGKDCQKIACQTTEDIIPPSKIRTEAFETRRKVCRTLRFVDHATRSIRLRGGRGLAPDPEDDSEIASDWILPREEPRDQEADQVTDDSSQFSAQNTDSYYSGSSEEVVHKVLSFPSARARILNM